MLQWDVRYLFCVNAFDIYYLFDSMFGTSLSHHPKTDYV
jgi:hypothetical protein